ncbi:MAG: hypothetical protein V4603_06330 [Pseudomonadota bacterium]
MNTNKLKLSLILLMITVPISLATMVYHFSGTDADFGSTSRGTLVLPVIDITELKLLDAEGKPAYLSFEELTANVSPDDYDPRPWQLLYLGSENCDAVCQERLYFVRQLHIRLSGEAKRVQRAYVVVGGEAVDAATLAYLQQEQADMRILHVDPATLAAALQRSVEPGVDPAASHYIYVMDPVGNIMLYFTPVNDAEAILKDVDKLLDQSSLG